MITLKGFLIGQYKDAKRKLQKNNPALEELDTFAILGKYCMYDNHRIAMKECDAEYKKILKVAFTDIDVLSSLRFDSVNTLFSNNAIESKYLKGIIDSYKDFIDDMSNSELYNPVMDFINGVKFLSKNRKYFIGKDSKTVYIARK